MAFQGHSSHTSTCRGATTNLLTPTCGNGLVQATAWGPALLPPGPNFAIAPFKSHCFSLYTRGQRALLQRCGVKGESWPVLLIQRWQVAECVASMGGRAPNLPRERAEELLHLPRARAWPWKRSQCPLFTLPPAASVSGVWKELGNPGKSMCLSPDPGCPSALVKP